MDENHLPKQSFRRGVGNAATPSSSLAQTWQATNPPPACHFRCDLLRSARQLPLALFASQFPTVANRLRPLSTPTSQRDLDALAAGAAPGRARTTRKEPTSKSRHHGCGIRLKTV